MLDRVRGDRPIPAGLYDRVVRDRQLRTVYIATAAVAVLVFTAAAGVLAAAFPYSEWDSFAYGDWSRRLAAHGSFDPLTSGQFGAARPLFYAVQGLVWRVSGTSFTSGRLLSLGFALLLLVGVWGLVRRVTGDVVASSLALLVVIAVPTFTAEALMGQSDVPAAAMVAVVATLALRPAPVPRAWSAFVAASALLAVLTKPTVLIPLGSLAVYLIATRRDRRGSPWALAIGLAAGLFYDLVMSLRLHVSLVTFLRSGSNGTIFGVRSAHERWRVLADLGFLGPALRLPVACALAYAVLALCGIAHRRAAVIALAIGSTWTIVGPLASGGEGSFSTLEAGFATVGFAALWAAFAAASADDAPPRRVLVVALVLLVPSVLVWAGGAAFTDRLVSAAWPGAALLVGSTLAVGVRRAARIGWAFALAPVPVVLAAVWIGVAGLDGLHGYEWVEVRSLGWAGLHDRSRTMNIVLPSIQSTLAAAEPLLGDGRLVTSDPRFSWFLHRVDTLVPLHCADVAPYRVFVLSTSDESEYEAQAVGGLATPAQWEACKQPRLQLVDAGDDGYAVFQISSAGTRAG